MNRVKTHNITKRKREISGAVIALKNKLKNISSSAFPTLSSISNHHFLLKENASDSMLGGLMLGNFLQSAFCESANENIATAFDTLDQAADLYEEARDSNHTDQKRGKGTFGLGEHRSFKPQNSVFNRTSMPFLYKNIEDSISRFCYEYDLLDAVPA